MARTPMSLRRRLRTSLVNAIPMSQKGAASGVATLTSGSIVVQPPAPHASRHAAGGVDELPQTAINANAAPYSAAPGIGEPTLALQAALDAAAAVASPVNPMRVVVGPGIYTGPLRPMPGQASPHIKEAVLWVDSNVTLDLRSGAVIRLANGQKLGAGANQGYVVCTKDPWISTTRENIHVLGGVIDSNANNQELNGEGNPVLAQGLLFSRTRNFSAEGTIVRNLKGTEQGPPGETFHFDANHCFDGNFINCEADGSGAVDTATGFSSNNSVGIGWINCKSHDMAHGQAYTHWQSSMLDYVSCRAWTIKGANAFNSERSDEITYSLCTAGGKAAHIPGTEPNPFFATDSASLACRNGFNFTGSTNITAVGCSARFSENLGVNIAQNLGLTAPTFTGKTATGSSLVEEVAITNAGLMDINYTLTAPGVPVNAGGTPSTVTGYVNNAGERFGNALEADPHNSLRMANTATATASGVAFTTALMCHSVQFIGGDLRGSATSVAIEAGCTDVYVRVKESLTLVDTFTEYGVGTVIRNRMGSSGYRRSGEAGAPIQRWLNSDGSTLLNLNGSKQAVFGGGRVNRVRAVKNEATVIKKEDHILELTEMLSSHEYELPKLSEVEDGTEFVLADCSGSLSASIKATFKANGADAIHGATALETAYGRRVALCLNKQWVCS